MANPGMRDAPVITRRDTEEPTDFTDEPDLDARTGPRADVSDAQWHGPAV
jgi:hypothetical protein